MVRSLQNSLRGAEIKVYYGTSLTALQSKLPIIVEMDVSDFAIGVVQSQQEDRV
jgi:hypothetical protein